jgi:hypothetical protein
LRVTGDFRLTAVVFNADDLLPADRFLPAGGFAATLADFTCFSARLLARTPARRLSRVIALMARCSERVHGSCRLRLAIVAALPDPA